jgi:hypothetical protein
VFVEEDYRAKSILYRWKPECERTFCWAC